MTDEQLKLLLKNAYLSNGSFDQCCSGFESRFCSRLAVRRRTEKRAKLCILTAAFCLILTFLLAQYIRTVKDTSFYANLEYFLNSEILDDSVSYDEEFF